MEEQDRSRSEERKLRDHLVRLLTARQAHADLRSALTRPPLPVQGRKMEGMAYTLWQLLEHMRIAQWDILRFSVDPAHVSPEFPDGYWPGRESPPGDRSWQESVEQFHRDLREMTDLIRDPSRDLFGEIPHGTGQTLLREALLLADHNAYHLGQIVLLRRLLGDWPPAG